jgi:hypothetical protein
MTEAWQSTGNEPSLGGQAQVRLSGLEPSLGGERRIKPDPRILNALLDDTFDTWQLAVNDVLNAGHGRIYALELIKIIAADRRRRSHRRGGLPVGYSTSQRIAATRALEAFGEEVSVQALIDLLNDREWWLGQYAVDALIAVGSPAVEELIAALSKSLYPIVRRRAALILGGIRDLRAVEPLTQALKDDPESWVRECAAKGLGQLRTRQAVPALQFASHEDPDHKVRRGAQIALEQLGVFDRSSGRYHS